MPDPMPRKPKAPTCDDCFFNKNRLCALELDEACATFRVEAVPSVSTLDLYTSGLGRTLLVGSSSDPGSACPAGGSLRLSLKKGMHYTGRIVIAGKRGIPARSAGPAAPNAMKKAPR